MLVLAVILMGSMLAVALRRREPAVGAQCPDPTARGPHDPETRRCCPTCRPSSWRASAPRRTRSWRRTTSGRRSTRATSRSLMADARAALDKLKDLTAADRVEGQAAAVEALGKALDGFAEGQRRRARPRGPEHQRQGEECCSRATSSDRSTSSPRISGSGSRRAASKPNPGAADVARLKTLVRDPRRAARNAPDPRRSTSNRPARRR